MASNTTAINGGGAVSTGQTRAAPTFDAAALLVKATKNLSERVAISEQDIPGWNADIKKRSPAEVALVASQHGELEAEVRVALEENGKATAALGKNETAERQKLGEQKKVLDQAAQMLRNSPEAKPMSTADKLLIHNIAGQNAAPLVKELWHMVVDSFEKK